MARPHRALAAVVALAIALSVFATACDDDNDAGANDTASQSSIDALAARVQRNEMMQAMFTLSGLGLHDMDEHLKGEGTIEGSFAPSARAAARVYALTDWDDSLQAEADEVRASAVALLAALEDENVEAAADAAGELHELDHDFSDKVWAIIAKDLPPGEGGVDEHDEAEGTPSADGPSADGTPGGDHDEAEGTPGAGGTPGDEHDGGDADASPTP